MKKDFKEIYKGDIKWLEDNTIFLTMHGSHLYGTNNPESDIDVKGIATPPEEYFFSYQKNFEQVVQNEPVDLVIYSLQKFIKLAADCNPNIIELLFADKKHWIISTPVFEELYKHRYEFLSTKAKHTFSGYAFSQLKRIKSHRSWLLNPIKHKPTREEFGLSKSHKISPSIMGAFDNLSEKNNLNIDGEVMKLLSAEKRYAAALTQYNQYINWKKNRNPKRAALEKIIGFDPKHGMHLVRLMKMCKEILTDGEVIVTRPDADELLEIRNGKWTYDQLIQWAEMQEKELNELYKNPKQLLPKKPNVKKIDKLCVKLIKNHLKTQKNN